MRNDFCVFILSNRRPDRVKTYKTLRSHKYTGPIFIVIDDEDPTRAEYEKAFGKELIVFSKAAAAKITDPGDNFGDHRGVIYARNICFSLAREKGFKYFMQLDDDYWRFGIRLARGMDDNGTIRMRCLDRIFEMMIAYFEKIPALSIAMSQGGDHIGGVVGNSSPKRKVMNTFLCDVDRPFRFIGRSNEDTSMYTQLGRQGALFLTFLTLQVNQTMTQVNAGGMSELYLDQGTYIKSFYSVIYTPSAVRVGTFADHRSPHPRYHHSINWNHCAAKIISDRYRVDDQMIPTGEMSARFNDILKSRGYRRRKTDVWNNRPATWSKEK